MPSSSDLVPTETLHCDTAEAFLAALHPSSESWRARALTWMFRGQADAAWSLVPSGLRELAWQELPAEGEDIQRELDVIRSFYDQADQHGLAIPDDGQHLRGYGWDGFAAEKSLRLRTGWWPPTEILSIIALAQHYGVPTRLLDWSWKARVAAYFAATGAIEKADLEGRLAVWALRADFVRHVWHPLPQGGPEPEIAVVTAPQATNPNLAAQAGVFVVDRRAGAGPLEDLIQERATALTESIPRSSKMRRSLLPPLRKLTLPWSEAGRLLRLLSFEGVSAATVFPGYGGIVDSLKERRHWK